MNDDDVVVLSRLSHELDIIGVIIGEVDGIVKIEPPYFIKYDPSARNLMMMPYCALTDETYFEFKKDHIEFLVTANPDVASKFMTLITSTAVRRQVEEEDFEPHHIAGNDTKH